MLFYHTDVFLNLTRWTSNPEDLFVRRVHVEAEVWGRVLKLMDQSPFLKFLRLAGRSWRNAEEENMVEFI